MAVYKRGKIWWYKFNWNGEAIRESTKQTNKRVAETMEAAHRTALAKGEVGFRERKTLSLGDYLKDEFLPTEHALLDDNGDGRGTEVQIDYLTEAQGGRAKAGKLPRPRKETADGARSAQIMLPTRAAE